MKGAKNQVTTMKIGKYNNELFYLDSQGQRSIMIGRLTKSTNFLPYHMISILRGDD